MKASVLLLASLALGCGAAEEPAPARAGESPSTTPSAGTTAEPSAAPGRGAPAAANLWYACAASSECVLVTGACGEPLGANATYAAEVSAEQQELGRVISCEALVRVPSHVECVSQVCSAVADVLPTAES